MKTDGSMVHPLVVQTDQISIFKIYRDAITSAISCGFFVLVTADVVRIGSGMTLDDSPKVVAMTTVALLLMCALASQLAAEAIKRARETRRMLKERARAKGKSR